MRNLTIWICEKKRAFQTEGIVSAKIGLFLRNSKDSSSVGMLGKVRDMNREVVLLAVSALGSHWEAWAEWVT